MISKIINYFTKKRKRERMTIADMLSYNLQAGRLVYVWA